MFLMFKWLVFRSPLQLTGSVFGASLYFCLFSGTKALSREVPTLMKKKMKKVMRITSTGNFVTICVGYSVGWNTECVWNLNGSRLFGIPMAFSFPMVFHFGQNCCHLVQNHWKVEQNSRYFVPISYSSVLEWSRPQLQLLLRPNIPKLNYWNSELQNVCYSNEFCIPMFGFQAPIVFASFIRSSNQF